jgi:signal transduction histidine kinase
MIVPIIATIVVGTNGLVNNIGDANNADRARTLSGLSAEAGALVQELQSERAKSTLLLAAPAGTPVATTARTEFDRQAQLTDDANKTYRLHRSAVADIPADFRSRLALIDTQLSDLLVMRQQITSGGDILGSTVVSRYRTIIDDLLGIRNAAAELATNAHLGADMRTAATISDMKEQASLERVVGLRVLIGGVFTAELRKEFNAAIIGQEQSEASFRGISEQWHRDLFDKTVAGGDLRAAAKVEGLLTPLNAEELPSGLPTADEWDKALFGKAKLLRTIESEFDKHNTEDATAERNLLQRNVLVGTGTLLGMLLLAILFAWMVARSMARSLRELRHGALTVAQYGLPQAVARLRDPALATQLTPHQLALQIAEPLPVRSRDEFGQVAEAFNAVHLEAVRTAAEQAALRSSVATMFVNLARRSQILVDRLIGHLDRLERGEEDPDRLSELFQLDHLATRMRRNDENLLVLAGADSTRVQREPAPLMDVLRAAQSEVEHYTRIEFGMIDRDIEISAHAVNDMVHLVAELLDNATAFSPPDSAVIVEARRVGDRTVLMVEDHGIGMSPEQHGELNERLANPPVVDVAVSRMMGLVVVARLAARHGVKVDLRPARERGTIAEATLPSGVVVPRALAGRSTAGMPTAGMPADGYRENSPHRPTTPAPRSPLASPLALESGPIGGGPIGGRTGFGAPLAGGLFGGTNGDRRGAGPAGYANGTSPTSGTAPTSGAAGSGGPAGPSTSRSLPAWSDLTGVNGHDVQPPEEPRGFVDPLPQRRSGDSWSFDSDPADDLAAEEPGGPIPRQRPETPEARAAEAPPLMGGPPAPSAWPPVQPMSQPPVMPDTQQHGYRSEAYPPVDMTAEIPRVRLDWEPTAADNDPAYDNAESGQRFVDETMELPIFRELESAWFQTPRRPFEEPSPPAAPRPAERPMSTNGGYGQGGYGHAGYDQGGYDQGGYEAAGSGYAAPTSPYGGRGPGGPPGEVNYGDAPRPSYAASEPVEQPMPTEVRRGSTDRATAGPSASWQTAADEGWQAAAAIAEQQEFSVTDTGLPKRVPMSQLVPGGIEKNATSAQRRSPESVRGLLSAYHRGVQRGRTRSDDPKTPEPTTAGPQNSQGGKEQEA